MRIETKDNEEQEWVPVGTPERSLDMLLADLQDVAPKGAVYLFTGAADPKVYGDQFEESVRALLADRVGIHMYVLTAPLLVMDEREGHPLLRLQDEPSLNGRYHLFHRIVRGVDAHFRVVKTTSGNRYYEEFPHRLLATGDDLQYLNMDLIAPRQREDLARNAITVFKAWSTHSDMVTPRVYLGSRHIIDKLMHAASTGAKSVNYLTQDDWLRLPGGQELVLAKRS